MQYVLGNMLNGAGGLNPDGLSLDLQFAADKTLTARRGPTPVFTRGSTGTFVGSNGLIQTAAVNSPRFDHTSAGVCRGLLIEESRTNLTTQSGNPASWTGGFTNNGATTAPDGSSNGVAAIVGTVSAITTPATGAITGLHAGSVFVKRNNTDWARIQVAQGAFAHAVNFWVNLATGAAGTLAVAIGTPTSLSAQVTPFGNSWYRIAVTASYPATASLTLSVISATADASVTRVAGSIYEVWGGQLEAGSFPTSYIPTVASSVVRSADVCSITGADFNRFYNSTSGTLLSEASISNLIGSNRGIIQVDSGTNLSILRHVYGFPDGGFRSVIRENGDSQTVLSPTPGTASTIQKRIIAYEGTSFASVTNGGAVATATRTMPTGLNAMRIGNLVDGSFYLSGHIAAIRFYKKRLPNAKLQALTA
jgi:hypothetical protein